MNNSKNGGARKTGISKIYDTVRVVAVIFLVVQILVVSYVVFGRFVLNKTPSWGEEFALLCMVWFSLLSASMAEYNKAHIGVKLNAFVFPPKGVHIIEMANHIIKIIIALFMIFAGIKLTQSTQGGIMPGMNISSAWLYLSIPVSGAFLLFTLILRIKEVFKWETP